MKKILYAIATFLLASTLVFLFVTPRKEKFNWSDERLWRSESGAFYEGTFEPSKESLRAMEARKRMVADTNMEKTWIDSLYLTPSESLKKYSFGGGGTLYRYVGWVTYKNGQWISEDGEVFNTAVKIPFIMPLPPDAIQSTKNK